MNYRNKSININSFIYFISMKLFYPILYTEIYFYKKLINNK